MPEFLTNLHQNNSQSIFSRTISPVSPVTVIHRVLDNISIPSRHQLLEQVRILAELQSEPLLHHLFLDLLPVGSEGNGPFVASFKCLIWSGGLNDVLFLLGAYKLFGLEVMFVGLVVELALLERRNKDVAVFSILIFRFIEVDRLVCSLHQFL
jgi:hypothetical protein